MAWRSVGQLGCGIASIPRLIRPLLPSVHHRILTVNEEVSDTRKLLDASTKKYEPPPGAHLYLVCFHLPVTISKVRQRVKKGWGTRTKRAGYRIEPPADPY